MVYHIQEPLYGDDNYLLVMDQEEMLPSSKAEVTADSLGLYGCIWLCIMRMP